MGKYCILAVLVLLCPVVSSAETYSWVDDRGTTSFTEDLSQVPKKYRNKVRVRGSMGPSSYEAPTAQTEVRETASVGKEPGGTVADNPGKKLYGDKSGNQWRIDFAGLKAEAAATDEQITEMNNRLADTSRMSRSEYLGIQESLKTLHYHKSEIAKKFDVLNEAASRAKVPAEFR